jgi:hypothetical protein
MGSANANEVPKLDNTPFLGLLVLQDDSHTYEELRAKLQQNKLEIVRNVFPCKKKRNICHFVQRFEECETVEALESYQSLFFWTCLSQAEAETNQIR